jgi:hypothetical protein
LSIPVSQDMSVTNEEFIAICRARGIRTVMDWDGMITTIPYARGNGRRGRSSGPPQQPRVPVPPPRIPVPLPTTEPRVLTTPSHGRRKVEEPEVPRVPTPPTTEAPVLTSARLSRRKEKKQEAQGISSDEGEKSSTSESTPR